MAETWTEVLPPCNVTCYVTLHPNRYKAMAIGSSGRIVVELDPELKKQLYAELERQGRTMKEWLTEHAQELLSSQLRLELGSQDSGPRNKALNK